MFDKLDALLHRFEEIMNELAEPGVTDNQQRFPPVCRRGYRPRTGTRQAQAPMLGRPKRRARHRA